MEHMIALQIASLLPRFHITDTYTTALCAHTLEKGFKRFESDTDFIALLHNTCWNLVDSCLHPESQHKMHQQIGRTWVAPRLLFWPRGVSSSWKRPDQLTHRHSSSSAPGATSHSRRHQNRPDGSLVSAFVVLCFPPMARLPQQHLVTSGIAECVIGRTLVITTHFLHLRTSRFIGVDSVMTEAREPESEGGADLIDPFVGVVDASRDRETRTPAAHHNQQAHGLCTARCDAHWRALD